MIKQQISTLVDHCEDGNWTEKKKEGERDLMQIAVMPTTTVLPAVAVVYFFYLTTQRLLPMSEFIYIYYYQNDNSDNLIVQSARV